MPFLKRNAELTDNVFDKFNLEKPEKRNNYSTVGYKVEWPRANCQQNSSRTDVKYCGHWRWVLMWFLMVQYLCPWPWLSLFTTGPPKPHLVEDTITCIELLYLPPNQSLRCPFCVHSSPNVTSAHFSASTGPTCRGPGSPASLGTSALIHLWSTCTILL